MTKPYAGPEPDSPVTASISFSGTSVARPTALTLAAQTMKGAAAMVLETGKHPGQLKDEVSSPGGTTIAGVEALEREGLRYAAMAGVAAATARSKELSKL